MLMPVVKNIAEKAKHISVKVLSIHPLISVYFYNFNSVQHFLSSGLSVLGLLDRKRDLIRK